MHRVYTQINDDKLNNNDERKESVSKTTILIGSTDSYTSYTLKELFKRFEDMDVIGEAKECLKFIRLNKELQPNVNIIDVGNYIFYDWVELVKQARNVNPGVKIVLLSDIEENILNFIEGLKLGVVGYLLSTAPVGQIVPAIRAVNAGITVVDPNLAYCLANRFVHHSSRNKQSSGHDRLTSREIEIIGLVAKGYTNKNIANTIKISENTVKAHLADIFSKLGVSNRTQAIIMCSANNQIDLQGQP
jgi:DNA-binding NarL/FixJ family response regulator